MTEQAEAALDLASVLEDHAAEIAATWAEKTHHLPGSHYGQVPLAELKTSAARAFFAFIDRLKSGSPVALDTFLHEVSMTRLASGFEISDLLEMLLLLREAAFPVLWHTYAAQPAMAMSISNQFDAGLRYMATRFVDLYAQEIAERL